MNPDRPPKNLSREAKKIWREINAEFELDYQAMVILKTALEAYSRLQAAREQIDAEGLTCLSLGGFLKPHPCLKIEKEARSGMLQAWRMLNLDLEPPGPNGQPAGS